MKLERKDLLINPKEQLTWAPKQAVQPTPLVMDYKLYVYLGLQDAEDVSRIGSVNSLLDNPAQVSGTSVDKFLDTGEDGCFDESGVLASAVVQYEDKTHLFYNGNRYGEEGCGIRELVEW